jgi:hypothetical protein
MHRPVLVAHSSFIEGSHMTKNTASGFILLLWFIIAAFDKCNNFTCSSKKRAILKKRSMRLSHPPDGSTGPKYKLLCFIYHNLFYQIQNALAFNWDTCCHLALCLWLLPFHCIKPSIESALPAKT